MASLTQFRYAVAVAERRHFGRAAKDCFVSQPTLSTQLSKLEEELGVVLFDRSRKPVSVTDAGSVLIDQFRAVLQEVDRIEEITHELQGVIAGRYRLGVIPTIAPHALPRILPRFSRAYPEVELIVSERTTDEIIAGLMDESLDGGLLASPLDEAGIVEFPIGREDFVAFHAPNVVLPMDGEGRVVLGDVPTEQLLLMQEGHCLRTQVVDLCSLPVVQNFTIAAGSLGTLVNMVRAGDYFTVLPAMAASELSELGFGDCIKPIAGAVPFRELAIAVRRRQARRAIREALVQVATEALAPALQNEDGRQRQASAVRPR
ncbi:MAG: LysR substrate-binding domain-containing protein [Myxococcota bacterium]